MNSLLCPLPLLFPSPQTLKPSSPKTLKPLTLKPSPPILAAAPAAPKPSSLAGAAATAVATAALLLSSLHSPALAAALTPTPAAVSETETESETLTDPEKERIVEESLHSNPNDVAALRALLELKVKSKNLDEAVAVVDRLIALEPGESDLPLLKAHLHGYQGNAELAKEEYEELIKKNPFLVEAYHGLVMAASNADDDEEMERVLKRVEEAVELCRKERRVSELRDFMLLLAQIRVIEGNYEDSLRIYEELVKEEPRDFRPYLCQGIIYTLMSKKDEAEKQFQKYRRLVPKGHPYAKYLDEDMLAMKAMEQKDDKKRKAALSG